MADYLATINLSATDHWTYDLKTLPRPTGRETHVITTEYSVGTDTTEPHDILVDKEGMVWFTDFGEMMIGKFDPKTLKLTEYPIKKFKPNAPEGLLSIEFDHQGKIWFDTMYQGSLGCLGTREDVSGAAEYGRPRRADRKAGIEAARQNLRWWTKDGGFIGHDLLPVYALHSFAGP